MCPNSSFASNFVIYIYMDHKCLCVWWFNEAHKQIWLIDKVGHKFKCIDLLRYVDKPKLQIIQIKISKSVIKLKDYKITCKL